jgi:hypothetical protein
MSETPVDYLARIGSHVSYEDMANPRRYGVVCDIRSDQWGTWFDVAWRDGHISTTDLRQRGWRLER